MSILTLLDILAGVILIWAVWRLISETPPHH